MTSGFLVLLPPSETKRDGGNSALPGKLTGTDPTTAEPEPRTATADELTWPRLESIRRGVARDLVELSCDQEASAKAHKLGAKIVAAETARNRSVRRSERMPAALRYTGVLYDALDAASLDRESWDWLGRHVAVHSALYGLVGSTEAIAAYRCSATSRLPGDTLRSRWRTTISDALATHDGTVLDLRSSSYAGLGPAGATAVDVDIVTDDGAGGVRALNHFNKKAKGELVRALATSPIGRSIGPAAGADEIATALRALDLEATVVTSTRIRLVVADPVRR